MRDIALLLLFLPMFGLSIQYAQIGILLWIWTAIIVPDEFMFGFMSDVQIGKVAFFVTLLGLVSKSVPLNAKFDRTFITLLMLTFFATISALTSIDDGFNNWFYYGKFIKMMVLAFLIFNVINTRARIHASIWAICLALGFLGSTQGMMYAKSGGNHAIIAPYSMGDNNAFALAMLMALPLLFYLTTYSASRLVKIALLICMVTTLISIIGSNSRGGFVGMLALALAAVANSRKKFISLVLIVLVGAAVYVAAPAQWFARVDTIQSASDDSSFMGRVVAWKMSTLVALDHPIFGGGFHAIQNQSVWLRYARNFSLLDFIPTDQPYDRPRAAHSIYFEVLGDLGFGGFALFLALLIISFSNTRSIKGMAKNNPELMWAHDLANMCQISLMVYCVSGAALSQAYFEPLYMIVAILARLRLLVGKECGVTQNGRVRSFTPANMTVRQPRFEHT